MGVIRTEAFDLAFKFVTETNENIFLTGKAGTGKTTFLKFLKENPVKNMAVAAPTGVAAINAGGITLHSMFYLPFNCYVPGESDSGIVVTRRNLLSRLKFNSDKLEFFHALELLIIDEASMVAAHTVDAIDTILRSVRRKQAPFGGVQVLFIGDLHQLQPVVKNDEWQILKEFYSSSFFFDSHVLREKPPIMIELKEIFRQKDKKFIDILNGIRENNLQQEHLTALNQRLIPNFIPDEKDEYITLTTHNNQANKINEVKLERLNSPSFKFNATIDREFPENMYPAEKELILKKGSQVMFIKNDAEEKRYFNGKIGIISSISDDEIIVTSEGEKINVNRYDWENISYSIDPETKMIKEKLLGTFSQYPLRLAWAITIHKSQGLTFQKAVIDAANAFANGQVYVALSRAVSLEGLILTSPLNDRFLGAHSNLKQWQDKNYNENSLPDKLDTARQAFMKQELLNTFSFENINRIFYSLKKEITENSTNPKIDKWLKELSDKQNSLSSEANIFKQQLQVLWNENSDHSRNEKINARVKAAAIYFSPKVDEWRKSMIEHPIVIKSWSSAKKIDKTLDEFDETLYVSNVKINLCLNGFRFNEISGWKNSIPKRDKKIKSSYVPPSKGEIKNAVFDDLHEMLNSDDHLKGKIKKRRRK